MITDVGCDDFKKAAENRERIKSKSHLVWWLWYEAVVKSYPHSKPLPWWIPQGSLPIISKEESRHLHKYGFHEIDKVDKEYYNKDRGGL